MVYRSVIFDLDGTLSDSSEGIMKGVRYAMERFGVTDIPEETLRRFIGPPLYDTFSQIFGLTSEQADRAVTLYREYYIPKGMYENRLYPGIKELLERLNAAGAALYICTSKPKAVTDRVLDYLGVAEAFQGVVGASMDRSLNDKPSLLRLLLQERQPTRPAVMVGDTRFDLEAAAACGLEAIAVRWGFGLEEELARADWQAETPQALGDYLLKEMEA